MKEKLVKIQIGQNTNGNTTKMSVWVAEDDEGKFDLMFQRNVQVEAKKIARDLLAKHISGALLKFIPEL